MRACLLRDECDGARRERELSRSPNLQGFDLHLVTQRAASSQIYIICIVMSRVSIQIHSGQFQRHVSDMTAPRP